MRRGALRSLVLIEAERNRAQKKVTWIPTCVLAQPRLLRRKSFILRSGTPLFCIFVTVSVGHNSAVWGFGSNCHTKSLSNAFLARVLEAELHPWAAAVPPIRYPHNPYTARCLSCTQATQTGPQLSQLYLGK